MERALLEAVRSRARWRCEYCRLPASEFKLVFTVDHVVARQHGGGTTLGNLAFCCPYCNSHKGPNLYGIDPASGQPCRLFNPRQDRWADHFRWDGILIVGTTPVGRTTVHVLAMNDGEQLTNRTELLRSGWLFRLDL